jgi:hypothetical protein
MRTCRIPAAQVLELPGSSPVTVAAFRSRAALSRVALTAGAARRALELSVAYAGEREQFGRPLAKFQAIQQHLAAMAGEVVLSKVAAEAAALAMDSGSDATVPVAAAKVAAGQAAGLVGAENLCHQAIFVDDATRAVMPPDPEMIQVGDAIWQRPQWRDLVQGAVRPVGVVEVLVLPQHHHQVAQVPDQGPVQQLTSAAANPPLRDRIHSRCLNSGSDDPDPGRLEHGIERLREAGVPVMQDELRSCPGIPQVHEQVPGLLDDPGLDRVLRGAQDPDAPVAVLDHRKDVHLRAIEQVSGEEVQR